MTTKHSGYREIHERMINAVAEMQGAGFAVWRAKIEDTMFDTKHGDVLPGVALPR